MIKIVFFKLDIWLIILLSALQLKSSIRIQIQAKPQIVNQSLLRPQRYVKWWWSKIDLERNCIFKSSGRSIYKDKTEFKTFVEGSGKLLQYVSQEVIQFKMIGGGFTNSLVIEYSM